MEINSELMRAITAKTIETTLRSALSVQIATVTALMQLLDRKGMLTHEDLAIFANQLADSVTPLATMDDDGMNSAISGVLRSFADEVLKLGEIGAPNPG